MASKEDPVRREISDTIRALMHRYQQTGWLGRSRPANPGKAVKQAAAIAYAQQRRKGRRIPGKPRA
ncbi:MAG TPA: hypothetical protein VK188_00115 [Holophaga sp.]|nr:hypothetical protein [Holophaga sp.]